MGLPNTTNNNGIVVPSNNEEEKLSNKAVESQRNDNRTQPSLHNTYKTSLLKQSQSQYKIIDEVADEESKSSIYNRTNGGE